MSDAPWTGCETVTVEDEHADPETFGGMVRTDYREWRGASYALCLQGVPGLS